MRKILFTVLFTSLFILTAEAQIKFGVKGGLNISGVSGKNASDFFKNNATGFYVGPTAELSLLGKFGLQGSILYNQKALKGKGEDSKSHKTGYIDVPVSFMYKFGLPIGIKPFIDFGPYINFKVSGKENMIDGDVDNIAEQWKRKSFGAGLNFGAGVELLSLLQVKANYGLGLTDNYKAGDYSLKDRTWSVSAAVFF